MTDQETTELEAARAEVAELRERLGRIGAYAAEQSAQRWGHSVAGQAFQRIARLARQGVPA